MTVSLHKRMSGGMYFRLAYTWAHAIDTGQDALVAGAPATVQNSYSTKSERGPSVTDQRQRLTISAIEEPNPFAAGQKALAAVFNHWKISGIMTYGSGRPANATVSGDPNQDGNTSNDRLPKYGRNALLGPDYASMDLRVARKIDLGGRFHLELTGESFNLLNRDNKRYVVTDNGYYEFGGTVREVLTVRGRNLLSGLFSATYKFHETDNFVCSATNAIVDAIEFLEVG